MEDGIAYVKYTGTSYTYIWYIRTYYCEHSLLLQFYTLTLWVLVANLLFSQYIIMWKPLKMTETLANGYSSESTQRELSNEYQHDRV